MVSAATCMLGHFYWQRSAHINPGHLSYHGHDLTIRHKGRKWGERSAKEIKTLHSLFIYFRGHRPMISATIIKLPFGTYSKKHHPFMLIWQDSFWKRQTVWQSFLSDTLRQIIPVPRISSWNHLRSVEGKQHLPSNHISNPFFLIPSWPEFICNQHPISVGIRKVCTLALILT